MELIRTVSELQSKLSVLRAKNKTIGLVPTMGALHAGHESLVKKCLADNDYTVVSVFVNPTQFNNSDDLANYPRVLDRDAHLLDILGVDFMFAPEVTEVYPEPDTRQFEFDGLDTVMEGVFRPGHFNGVAQVVSRLFDIVKPDRAYFGEKDFQQLAIIRNMVKKMGLAVRIVPMPIVRQADGLALSSRNELLTDLEKHNAVNISKVLSESKTWMTELSVQQVIDRIVSFLNERDLRVEYYQIVDGDTLQPVSDWADSAYIVGCIAAFCGKVRLIDNITYKNN